MRLFLLLFITVFAYSAEKGIIIDQSFMTTDIYQDGVTYNIVSFTYDDPLCKKVRVYVPKGKAYSFRHLEGSIKVDEGTYTLIASVDCN